MQIHPSDNVEVRPESGHKYALRDIATGEKIIKYGFPIGHATEQIPKGAHVHTHNVKSNLSGTGEWRYKPAPIQVLPPKEAVFQGYVRANGDVGIRNELWIVPTVGCVNGIAKTLAEKTGAKALTHPYGCSQLGDDLSVTQKMLCGLIRHPNAGGVLVLGLGCENNTMDTMKALLSDCDPRRVRFLNTQDVDDEIEAGLALLQELSEEMKGDRRVPVPVSKLKIGIKCGGSDGYSGITANPMVGRISDRFAAMGTGILMTEIPEVFGAEEILLARAVNEKVFEKCAAMIRDFRTYFIDHGEGIGENPSPGNMAGGITTLEDKSLGCVQKAGKVPLCDAVHYGETAGTGGLYLVDGPGNDQVAVTNLTAAGAHMILFTTGRGTPLAAPVPTLKVSTNTPLAMKKKHWIDFNAGRLLDGVEAEVLADELEKLCFDTANGQPTRSEENGYFDIAIFKDGVTL